MVSILIVTHTPLASALKQVVAHVYPEEARRIAEFDVPSELTAEGVLAALDDRLRSLGDGPVLILTDVFGSTHCNAVRQLALQPRILVETIFPLP